MRADFVNPMRLDTAGSDGTATTPTNATTTAPAFVTAGRYTFALARTAHDGWRLTRVTVHEKWRRISS